MTHRRKPGILSFELEMLVGLSQRERPMREFGMTSEEEVVFIDGKQIFEKNGKVQAFREENSGHSRKSCLSSQWYVVKLCAFCFPLVLKKIEKKAFLLFWGIIFHSISLTISIYYHMILWNTWNSACTLLCL